MAKRILAVIIGLVVGVGVIFVMEDFCDKLYPPPAGTDFNNPESLRVMMLNMPAAAFHFLIIAYVVASFAGGVVASLIAGAQKPNAAIIVGAVLLALGILNIETLPGHPVWFMIASSVVYIPSSYLGYVTVKKKLNPSI